MPHLDVTLVAAVFAAIVALEYATGVYRRNPRPGEEWAVDFIAAGLVIVIKPVVLFLSVWLSSVLLVQSQGALSDWPFWAAFALAFLPDDFSHYWLHRLAHERKWLWGFHRTHHTASVYQTSVAFRENWLWFWIMPGFWWAGLMVYLGLTEAVIASTALIGLHNVWLHSGLTWDRVLYRNPATRRAWRAFEHVVNTPGLHRGHHGLGENGVPMGNYGQTLFIWDVLFGTAEFRDGAIPDHYGTMRDLTMKQRWYYHLWWPLFGEKPAGRAGGTAPERQEKSSASV